MKKKHSGAHKNNSGTIKNIENICSKDIFFVIFLTVSYQRSDGWYLSTYMWMGYFSGECGM